MSKHRDDDVGVHFKGFTLESRSIWKEKECYYGYENTTMYLIM